MTKRSLDLLTIPGFAIALTLSLAGALPVKEYVKTSAEMLGPLAPSAGMLASFIVFLLIFLACAGPATLLWSRQQKKETTVTESKQVPYGYHTPVPR